MGGKSPKASKFNENTTDAISFLYTKAICLADNILTWNFSLLLQENLLLSRKINWISLSPKIILFSSHTNEKYIFLDKKSLFLKKNQQRSASWTRNNFLIFQTRKQQNYFTDLLILITSFHSSSVTGETLSLDCFNMIIPLNAGFSLRSAKVTWLSRGL